ncbi:MAG: hypothetical protein V7K91_11860 [Nostoc sp.]
MCHCDEGSNRKTLVKNYSSQARQGLAANAEVIITGDLDLLVLTEFNAIPI